MTTPHQIGNQGNGVVKTRRSHRKSRNGCSECKRRHIRCDERRPACTNCTIAERACSFPNATQPQLHSLSPATDSSSLGRNSPHSQSCEPEPQPQLQPQPQPQPQTQSQSQSQPLQHAALSWPVCSPEVTPMTPMTTVTPAGLEALLYPASASMPTSASTDRFRPPTAASTQTLPSFTESFSNKSTAYFPPAPPPSLFTAQHLMLLHHASTSAERDSVVARDQVKGVVDIAIRYSVDAPYLIDQFLALSALHLAVRTSESGEPSSAGTPASLRHQATELQTRAVSSFTRLTADLPAEDKATCVPRFLFASLLSLQVLTETLHQHRQNPDPQSGNPSHFHGFIQRMVECMHLHRGMLSLIRPTWSYLMQSELSPLLQISHDAANTANVKFSQGSECKPLVQLIKASSVSTGESGAVSRLEPASAEACLGCIERLQWGLDMQNSLPDQDVPHAASGFIVTIPAEFVGVLRTLRPEALIILAYFGVLLHRCRRFWTFENVGANMIRAIAGHLGSHWHEALAWPLKVIETEND